MAKNKKILRLRSQNLTHDDRVQEIRWAIGFIEEQVALICKDSCTAIREDVVMALCDQKTETSIHIHLIGFYNGSDKVDICLQRCEVRTLLGDFEEEEILYLYNHLDVLLKLGERMCVWVRKGKAFREHLGL